MTTNTLNGTRRLMLSIFAVVIAAGMPAWASPMIQLDPAPQAPDAPPSMFQRGLSGALRLGGQVTKGTRDIFGEVIDDNRDLIKGRLKAGMLGRNFVPPSNPYFNSRDYGGNPPIDPYGYSSNPPIDPYGYSSNPPIVPYNPYASPAASSHAYGCGGNANGANPMIAAYSGARPIMQSYGNPPVSYHTGYSPGPSASCSTRDSSPGSSAYSPDGSPCCEQSSDTNVPDSVANPSMYQRHHQPSSIFGGYDCNAAFPIQSSRALLLGAAFVAIGLAAL